MLQASLKSCSLEMLLDMLIVSDSKLTMERNNKADANVIAENYDVVKHLKIAIAAKRAAETPGK